MKKILGISLVALFAVAPFAADATLTSKGYVDAKLAEKQNAATAVTHTANTAVGSAKIPVYVGKDGAVVTGDELKALAYKDSLAASDIPDIAESQVTNLTSDLAAKQDVSKMVTDDNIPTVVADKKAKYPSVYTAEKIADQVVTTYTNKVSGDIGDIKNNITALEAADTAIKGNIKVKSDGNYIKADDGDGEGTVALNLGYLDTAVNTNANAIAGMYTNAQIDTAISTAVAGKDTLAEMDDATINTPTNGQILKYDGAKWVNDTEYSYTLPTASNTVKGGVTVDGTTITADANGKISVETIGAGKVTGLAAVATGGKFNDLTDKPTTLAGYGITDAATFTQGGKADTAVQTVTQTGTGIVKTVAQNGTAVSVTAGALVEDDIPTLSQSKISGLGDALNAKQVTLVSGTNIKTVGGTTLLGSGNIAFPTVDQAYSSTSENAASGKAVAQAVGALEGSLGALAHLQIPAGCKSEGANCVLVYKGATAGFVLEDVERASSTETDGQTSKLTVL